MPETHKFGPSKFTVLPTSSTHSGLNGRLNYTIFFTKQTRYESTHSINDTKY